MCVGMIDGTKDPMIFVTKDGNQPDSASPKSRPMNMTVQLQIRPVMIHHSMKNVRENHRNFA
jgi:hypothetical protein